MRNLISDLKLFLQNGGERLILKHDFHHGDDFLEGYRIVSRDEIGGIIEFFANEDDERLDSDVFEYMNGDSVDLYTIEASLSIHSTSDRDVGDMERIFGQQLCNCYWLHVIAACVENDQLTVSEDTFSATLTPEILKKFYAPNCFPFASVEAIKMIISWGRMEIDLSGLSDLSEECAKIFSGNYDLNLSGLNSISNEVARGLSKHTGTLDLSGLKTLSFGAAEHLAQHKGSLYLGGLTEISDEVAQALSKHHGTLTLTGLTSLSDTAAEALSKHDGEVELPDFDGGEDEDDLEEDEEE
jgi:hypothetical protein